MINKEKFLKVGQYFFFIGIFALASAPFISAIFFLISLIFSFYFNFSEIIKDKCNYPLIGSSLIMLIVTVIQNISYLEIQAKIDGELLIWTPKSSWIGLANWIPLFLGFMGFQTYLSSNEARKICAKLFVAGSLPVLLTGFGQYFFEWHGPLYIFNKLIIWFQRPLNRTQGLSGLFNNQNYAGCWLNIIWPFSIALFNEKTSNIFKKGFSLSLIISVSLAIFLTSSRSAWGGLLITLPILIGGNTLLIIFLFLILVIVLINLNTQIGSFLTSYSNLIPEKFNLLDQFNPSNILPDKTASAYENPAENRSYIFIYASKMIKNKLFLGWGASSFPIYYFLKNNFYTSHPHNLFFELTLSYGILPSIMVFTLVSYLCILSLKKFFFIKTQTSFNDLFFEKAWWTSFIVLLASQMIDLQYFDGRISFSFWILLAGLRQAIKETNDIKVT